MDNNDKKDNFNEIEKWSTKISEWTINCAKTINDLVAKHKNSEGKITKLEDNLKKTDKNLINITRQYTNTLRELKQLKYENRNIEEKIAALTNVIKELNNGNNRRGSAR